MKSYKKRLDENINIDDHDVGFIFSPSCVALYKVTGDELAKENSLRAAEHLYKESYSQKGGFIILGTKSVDKLGVRTIMDTLMNIQLFFWAYEETGDEKFLNAAKSQITVTDNTLIRPDGSSFHHYLFDKETHMPDHGFTFQGHSDDSCWSRGHAWSVYALARAFDYTGDNHYLEMHHDVTNFSLNHLPDDGVTY